MSPRMTVAVTMTQQAVSDKAVAGTSGVLQQRGSMTGAQAAPGAGSAGRGVVTIATSNAHGVSHTASNAGGSSSGGPAAGVPGSPRGGGGERGVGAPEKQRENEGAKGSAALNVNSLKQLSECLHHDLTHKSLEKWGQCDLEAFERFVAQWSGVFCALLKLLLPLCFQAPEYIREEIFLTEKGMAHSNGELRARMSSMANRHQLYLLGWINQRYTRPRLEALRKERSEKKNAPRKNTIKAVGASPGESATRGAFDKLAVLFSPRGI